MVWKATPKVGTMREFHDVKTYNKKNHKVKFFFKTFIPRRIGYYKFYCREKFWEFLHKYHPKHKYHLVDSGLSPGYYDIPSLMTHTLFSFLVRYVEGEDCFGTIVWDGDKYHECVRSELEDLYWWWKNERIKRDSIEKSFYARVSDHILGEATEEDRAVYKELFKFEEKWKQEDIYNMKRLVSIKNFMWS